MAIWNSHKIPILVYSKVVTGRKVSSKIVRESVSTKQYFGYNKPCSKTEKIRIKHLKLIINLRYLISDKLHEVII